MTAGTRALPEADVDHDAECVAAARRSGWVPIGKTNMDELALGNRGTNPHFGRVPNPAAPNRLSGGSSGGSAAAVAAGLCRAAFGTDTGGSIRVPAALCGVVGFRPRPGYISSDGVVPLCPTLDSVGVIARDCHDAALLAAAARRQQPDVQPKPPLRLGRPPAAWLAGVDDDVGVQFADVLARAPVATECLRLPDRVELSDATLMISLYEGSRIHARLADSPDARLGLAARKLIESGLAIATDDYRMSRELVAARREEVLATLAAVDALVLPATPSLAPLADVDTIEPGVGALADLCRPFSGCAVAAITIPIPNQPVPAGMQVVATTEAGVLGAAMALEAWMRQTTKYLEG